jgi:hypothetical protein
VGGPWRPASTGGQERAFHLLARLWLIVLYLLPVAKYTSAPVAAGNLPGPVTITWLESSPAHPAILYAGGYLGQPDECIVLYSGDRFIGCTLWAARSLDAGATWTPLVALATWLTEYALHPLPDLIYMNISQCSLLRNPFLLSPNGMDVFLGPDFNDCSTGGLPGGFPGWPYSRDRGQHWRDLYASPVFMNDAVQCCSVGGPPAISPADPRRLYLEAGPNPSDTTGYALYLFRSDDVGAHWRMVVSESRFIIDKKVQMQAFSDNLLADAADRNTVYVAFSVDDYPNLHDAVDWGRSEDGGLTWQSVSAPSA